MPIRLTNRFSADRDLGPARLDTNFEDVRRWSSEIDSTFETVNDSISTVNTNLGAAITDLEAFTVSEVNGLTTFANAIQSDLTTESGARAAADTVLDTAVTTLQGDVTTLQGDVTAAEADIAAAEADIIDLQEIGRHCTAHRPSSIPLNVATATTTFVSMNSLEDDFGWHTTGWDYIRPTTAGWYEAGVWITWNGGFTAGSDRFITAIRHNSTIVAQADLLAGSSTPDITFSCRPVQCNGSTDYFRPSVWQGTGVTRGVYLQFWVTRVR